MKILLLDGQAIHSLAIVRGLGRAGHAVHVAALKSRLNDMIRPLAMQSRYCANPRNLKAADFDYSFSDIDWQAKLESRLSNLSIDCLLPLKAETFKQLVMSDIKARMLFPPKEAFWICYDKCKTFDFLTKNGLPMPRTGLANLAGYDGPIVTKPGVSQGSVGLRYRKSIADCQNLDEAQYIIQEYIPGDRYGFFALYFESKLHSYFMHRRLREYPVTGGPSSCAMSTNEPELFDIGKQVFDKLGWHGVGMIECIKDRRTNQFKIIEINPKFWGSIDLAIHAGVNFPEIFCQLAAGNKVAPVTTWRSIRFRWLFPNDFMHMLSRFGFSRGFWGDFFNGTEGDIDLQDIIPNIFQPLYAFGYLKKYGIHWRYPNGKIK